MSTLLTELATHYQNEKYPGLARLDYCRRWLDGLLSIIESYLMTFSTVLITVGISFSMYDFLTNGTALNNPTIFQIWAIVQTIAIDAQLVNMWFRLKVAIRERRAGLIFLYSLLGLALALVAFGASTIPALQKSLGISFDQAIISAGISPVWMIWGRSGVAILLVIIAAFQRSVIHFDRTGKIKNLAEIAPISEEIPDEKGPGFFSKLLAKWANIRMKKTPEIETKSEDELKPEPEQKQPEIVEETGAENEPEEPYTLGEMVAEIASIILPKSEVVVTDPDIPVVQPLAPSDWQYQEYVTQETEAIPASTSLEQDIGQSSAVSTQYVRYTPEEAVKLEICRSNRVKLPELKAAMKSGELKQNSLGKVSKTAVENWLKSRQLVSV